MYKYDSGRTARQVYEALYADEGYATNERSLNTEHLFADCNSLLDIGCGRRPFVAHVRDRRPSDDRFKTAVCDITAAALEYQVQVHNIEMAAWANLGEFLLPFNMDDYDAVTCFGTLEHVPECNVKKAIEELIEVAAKRVVLTFSCHPSRNHGPDGEPLHLTIRPLDWWHERIRQVAGATQPIRVVPMYTRISDGKPMVDPVTVLDFD